MGATAVLGEDVAAGNPVPRSPRLRRPSPTVMVAVAAFGAFLAFIDSTVVNVAFPNLETSFPRTGVAGLSWVLNAYNIVFAGFLVAAGRLADLFGRRRLFKLGLAVFTLASGLCALAPSVAALVAFRAVQGAGAALLLPASLGIVVRAAPAERRSHALSVWAAAGALAAGLGPPLGGALVDLYDWRLVFIVNVPLGLLAWMLAHRLVTESRAPGRREMPDLRGAALLSLAITALTLGIVEGPAWGWSSPGVVTAFAGSAAAALLCVGSSMHHRSPVIDPRLLRIRGFTVSSAVTVAAALGLYTYLLTHILWLHDVWGYPIVVAGLAVAPGALVAAAVAGPLGRLADRRGPRAVVVPGALIWAGAFLWYLTRVGVHPDFLGAWLPGQVLSGIGVGATLPVATAGGLAAVPAGRYATASAVNSAARQVGAVMGISILTVFIAHPTAASLPGQLRHGWEMAAIAFLVAAGAAALFGRVRATDAASLAGARAPRLRTGHLPELLPSGPAERSDLLSLLPATAREALIAAGRSLHLRAGETLVRQGDPGDTLYVLRSGSLAVQHPGSPPFALGAGSVVGELALLTGAPRSATVVARRDSALVALTRDRFDEVAAREPELLRAVAVGLAQMVQLGRPVPRDAAAAPRVIAVVALDEGAPVAALADLLHRGLTASGSLRVARIDDAEPEALERAEAEHDRVLLVAGPDGAWHDACLRQAGPPGPGDRRGPAPPARSQQPCGDRPGGGRAHGGGGGRLARRLRLPARPPCGGGGEHGSADRRAVRDRCHGVRGRGPHLRRARPAQPLWGLPALAGEPRPGRAGPGDAAPLLRGAAHREPAARAGGGEHRPLRALSRAPPARRGGRGARRLAVSARALPSPAPRRPRAGRRVADRQLSGGCVRRRARGPRGGGADRRGGLRRPRRPDPHPR